MKIGYKRLTRHWRGDGADEDVDGDDSPPTRGVLVMTMAAISASGREVFPAGSSCRSSRLVTRDGLGIGEDMVRMKMFMKMPPL